MKIELNKIIETKEPIQLEGKPYKIFQWVVEGRNMDTNQTGTIVLKAFTREKPNSVFVGNVIEGEKDFDKYANVHYYKIISEKKFNPKQQFIKDKPKIVLKQYLDMADDIWNKVSKYTDDIDKQIILFEKALGVASVMNIDLTVKHNDDNIPFPTAKEMKDNPTFNDNFDTPNNDDPKGVL